MDPGIDSEWLTCKNDLVDESQPVGNVTRSWQWRELGITPPRYPPNKTVLENAAEDILVQKSLDIRSYDLPGYPRSTFLMVFSPDGTKVASTHGNHNVYVSELASGKHVRILRGHPRTPWCVAFHPSHPQLIGSGCLGGQVRVWDISSGGSEVWSVQNETVIASIAFHPRDQLLVIATYNELYFWDWSRPVPFTRVSTNNINEKVRYVAFDALGFKLITGISLSANLTGVNSVLQQNPMMGPTNNQNNNRRDDNDNNSGNRGQDNSGSAQDMIVNSYQNLVQRYDSLVRNYQRLFMVRHRLTNTPPPPSTIDRGTDPMESDMSINPAGAAPAWASTSQDTATNTQEDEASQSPEAPRPQENTDSGDGEGSSSRLLNLDVLSFGSNPTRQPEPSNHPEYAIFGSRSSAFQPLTEGRSFRTVDQNERSTRLLPNPFSHTHTARTTRSSLSDGSRPPPPNLPPVTASRTSIFTSSRSGGSNLSFLSQGQNLHRNASPFRDNAARNAGPSLFTEDPIPTDSTFTSNVEPNPSPPRPNTPSASSTVTNTRRPSMTNSSTQMSPVAGSSIDAQTINESLDLIRDILRDSGTRLLNLITNMSLSTLANVERNMPRRGGARAQSDDSEGGGLTRGGRPRVRLFSSTMRRDLLSSSSDSDSDQSLEVNIFRTRNSTFQDNEYRPIPSTSSGRTHPTDRMEIELNDDPRSEERPTDLGGINVLLSTNRFRVRTQNNAAAEEGGPPREPRPASGNRTPPPAHQNSTPDFNPNRPSTSREGPWARNVTLPPEEAYRKVRLGVNLLQKHTMHLTDLWLRGNRVTMRELRLLWENLRRRILVLHRETGRQDLPSQFYTRSLLDRCMMLTEMGDVSRTTARNARNMRTEGNERTAEDNNDAENGPENLTTTASENSGTSENVSESRNAPSARPGPSRPASAMRSSPSLRRRLQSSYRWRPEDEMRRRSRNPISSRLATRYTNRSRRDIARAFEISTTRHEIRMRAMQVLSIMFNIMMMCLEERGLSQLIISMLRTLKKALALTCLMLMMNRNTGRTGNSPASSASRMASLNIIRIQNADHSEPVNVDGSDEPASPSNLSPRHVPRNRAEETSNTRENVKEPTEQSKPSTSKAAAENSNQDETSVRTSIAAQRWSNRLAVQISAANRNNSATARNRRELYLESKRLKALHRTNPHKHPLIKKRVPPVSTHRIPALRLLPTRLRSPRLMPQAGESQAHEPVAGPSTGASPPFPPAQEAPRDEMLNEFEQRVNLIRIAHLQAVRMRNAARTRFRRLQTIRLYTPSSVREMFDLHSNNSDNPPGSRSPLQGGPELGNRRSFAAYRPYILTPRSDAGRPADEPGHFHTVLNNVAMPLMHVGETPAETSNNQPQRLPRIHEYLQPILLAQNAMVVDEEAPGEAGGGAGPRRFNPGMPGLLDVGIISETLPAPSHRVQAWDFTAAEPPDIADSNKNIVVQRCRIHNDASIDISKDGRILVALLPVPRLRNTNHWLGKIGVYSLEWSRLGQCVHTCVLEQSAVSVALSPTARHLAVGLGTRRFASAPHPRTNVFALLYRLEPLESSSRTGLSPIKELEHNWEAGFTSLNCLRWAPQPGQGLVYANNTGQLVIMS